MKKVEDHVLELLKKEYPFAVRHKKILDSINRSSIRVTQAITDLHKEKKITREDNGERCTYYRYNMFRSERQ